jgi:uncharacterized membrane protein
MIEVLLIMGAVLLAMLVLFLFVRVTRPREDEQPAVLESGISHLRDK